MAIGLTDHDCIAGLEEARLASVELGIEFVPGCEIAVKSEYGEIHLLGLWVETNNAKFNAALENILVGRTVRNKAIIAKLQALGMKIDYDYVLEFVENTKIKNFNKNSVGRPHIAGALLSLGLVANIKEAFLNYIGQNAPAYVAREILEIPEGIELLRGAGATVAWAHPMLTYAPKEWIDAQAGKMAALGLDAIETYHSEYSGESTRLCVDLANKYSLELSGGSDYHGTIKPGLELGKGRGGLRVPKFVLDRLKKRRIKQGLGV